MARQLGVVAGTRAIIVRRRVVIKLRGACLQRSTSSSAFGNLRPGLSAYAIEQIIELNEVFGVRGVLPVFSLFNVLHQDVRTGASLKPFYHMRHNAHLLEVIELHATAFAITWLGRLFALGQLHRIRALAFSQRFSFGDRRRWAHVAHFVPSLPCVME